jgi:hypothetical protein
MLDLNYSDLWIGAQIEHRDEGLGVVLAIRPDIGWVICKFPHAPKLIAGLSFLTLKQTRLGNKF